METPGQPHDDDGSHDDAWLPADDDWHRELRAVDPVERAAAAAALGLRHRARVQSEPAQSEAAQSEPAQSEAAQSELAHLVGSDPDGRVRSAALAALDRIDPRARAATDAWHHARLDPDPAVRRRAFQLAPRMGAGPDGAQFLVTALNDPEVAEVAAWALGELGADAAGAIAPLASVAAEAADPLVREAAVAALGALGDPAGLPAILGACADKPAIRRRAILALAPFSGPEVEAAIDRALTDKDWQVRQVAEDLRNADK